MFISVPEMHLFQFLIKGNLLVLFHCNIGEMNISKPMGSWTSYKAQLKPSRSSILHEISSGQRLKTMKVWEIP